MDDAGAPGVYSMIKETASGVRSLKVGYACINTSIKEHFRTCRVATVEKKGPEILKELTLENLKLTKRIIEWNIEHGIKFYRMTSEMVVLATHPVNPWDWRNDPDVIQACSEIKMLRDEHGLRLSTHPGQYSVLNSPNPDVVDRTIADLDYHAALSELTGAQDMILHLGGKYGDPEAALGRLVNETRALPEPILKRLRFENDDRTYNLERRPVCQRSDRRTGLLRHPPSPLQPGGRPARKTHQPGVQNMGKHRHAESPHLLRQDRTERPPAPRLHLPRRRRLAARRPRRPQRRHHGRSEGEGTGRARRDRTARGAGDPSGRRILNGSFLAFARQRIRTWLFWKPSWKKHLDDFKNFAKRMMALETSSDLS
uniref:UvdE n=1 Tax=Bhargavaea cecembensis TaxID=394098 RepID=G3GHX8_9BACL|nr:UvdE [Bhargavaea cecembensis]